jgi:hypothetical protein
MRKLIYLLLFIVLLPLSVAAEAEAPSLNPGLKFSFPSSGITLKIGNTYDLSWTGPAEEMRGFIDLWLQGKKLENGNYEMFPLAGNIPLTNLPAKINDGKFAWYVPSSIALNNFTDKTYYTFELNPQTLMVSTKINDAPGEWIEDGARWIFPDMMIVPGEYYIFASIFKGGDLPRTYFRSEKFFLSDTKESITAGSAGSDYSWKLAIKNSQAYARLRGRIVLKVEDAGKAYYIHPSSKEMYYLGKPGDAFAVMRSQGIGIKNSDLEKIEIGSFDLGGQDTDGDALSDSLEEAIGTDKSKKDTDGDGYSDKDELRGGFSPLLKNKKLVFDRTFSEKQKGKILLQVEKRGEAWYVNPNNGKRYFLGRPADAFKVMRDLGLGISNQDFTNL